MRVITKDVIIIWKCNFVTLWCNGMRWDVILTCHFRRHCISKMFQQVTPSHSLFRFNNVNLPLKRYYVRFPADGWGPVNTNLRFDPICLFGITNGNVQLVLRTISTFELYVLMIEIKHENVFLDLIGKCIYNGNYLRMKMYLNLKFTMSTRNLFTNKKILYSFVSEKDQQYK